MLMNDNNKLIKCRKCGGNHLTIKCCKDKKEEFKIDKSSEIIPIKQDYKLETRDNQFNTTRNNQFETTIDNQFNTTRNNQFNTRDNQFETRDNRLETRDNRLETRNNQFNTRDNRFETRDNRLETRNNQFNTRDNRLETRDNNKYYNDKRYKVKILNLPNNFEYSEISEFAKDWGHVLKINTKNFDNSSIAVVEFKYEQEADYFIEALDNTPYEHYILKVTKIEE
jgi:hypothetical protein